MGFGIKLTGAVLICSILIRIDNIYASDSEQIESQDQVKQILTDAEYNHEEVKKSIDDASIDAQRNAEDARKSIIEASKIVKKSNSQELIEIAKNKLLIEQSRKAIARIQLTLAEDLKKTNENLDKTSLALKKIESEFLRDDLPINELKELYKETVFYWRVLADNSLKFFSKTESNIEIPVNNPDKLPQISSEDSKDQELMKQYQDSYQSLQTEYKNILQLKTDLNSANKNYRSNLLLKSGKLRANLLQMILSSDSNFIIYNNGYVDDLVREIKLIPYRPIATFYSKILRYKQAIDSGFVGFVYILKQVGLLMLLIFILALGKNILLKITNLFDEFCQFCVKQSIADKSYIRIAILLSKTSPYFKWLSLILIFFLASVILENSLISELAIVIPYFQYLFLYKIFRIFTHHSLNKFIYKNFEELSSKQTLNNKVRSATKSLGLYLLSSVYLLHFTQTIVRKAYFYNLTLNVFAVGLFVILSLIASDWADQIKIISTNKFPKKFGKIIQNLLSTKKRSILFSLPILLILLVRNVLYKSFAFLRNYDFFKNLLSQIYRKKLESAAKKSDLGESNNALSINKSYIKEFSKSEKSKTFIAVKDHPYLEIKTIINNWQSGKSEENSIAIHAERGLGKSDFVKKIMLNYEGIKILKTTFDVKVTRKDDLVKTIANLFNEDLSEKDLFKFLLNYEEETIIILDDCHNIFLAREGGFRALKLFFNFLVKINNPNLLWISTFDSISWYYLQNSVKISNYFRHILRLPKWSDDNIRELIMNKHDKTGFRLTYDPLIFAINTNRSEKEFEDLQLKFFQIIWSQSRGNPAIAIFLWLSSLNKGHAKTIKISLPKVNRSSHLSGLSDDHLFVYASIIKHQNLSIGEISDILSISKEEILNIIRIGLEKGYLEEIFVGKKRFAISYEWQITISQLLINRNFIYAE